VGYGDVARSVLVIPVVIGLVHFLLSMRFWCSAPAAGSEVTTASFMAAGWTYRCLRDRVDR
jgi:hypothetical protein